MYDPKEKFEQWFEASEISRYQIVYPRPQFVLFPDRWLAADQSVVEHDVLWAVNLKPRGVVCDRSVATRLVLSTDVKYSWTAFHAERMLWQMIVGEGANWFAQYKPTAGRNRYSRLNLLTRATVWAMLYRFAEMDSTELASWDLEKDFT
jgi:hypothetical protein